MRVNRENRGTAVKSDQLRPTPHWRTTEYRNHSNYSVSRRNDGGKPNSQVGWLGHLVVKHNMLGKSLITNRNETGYGVSMKWFFFTLKLSLHSNNFLTHCDSFQRQMCHVDANASDKSFQSYKKLGKLESEIRQLLLLTISVSLSRHMFLWFYLILRL